MDDRNGMDGCNITDDRCVIRITYKRSAHADACDRELILIPRCLKLGIGCRKGVSKERIEEARATGAKYLVTACPWCKSNFTEVGGMDVVDILDLAADAL